MPVTRTCIASLAILGLFGFTLAPAARAGHTQLILNGGFESGTFLPAWSTFDQPGSTGTFFISSGTATPLTLQPVAGPNTGVFYALSDQGDNPSPPPFGAQSASALYQSFTTPAGAAATSISLSFALFVYDQSGQGTMVNGGLDYTVPDNQYARVDLLRAGSNPLSTAPADLVNAAPFYEGVDAGAPPPYTPYSFDITALLAPNTTYLLRFAEVQNVGALNVGVDDVNIDYVTADQPNGVPEPVSLILLASAGVVLGGCGWRLRRQGARVAGPPSA